MSDEKKLTEAQAIKWILHHWKQVLKCAYTIDGQRWRIGEPSEAEAASKGGHFWEVNGGKMRIWKRCVDAKTLNPEWIAGQWCNAAATAHAMESLGKRCPKCSA